MQGCEHFTAGIVCRARCTHRSFKSSELSFKDGDPLTILKEMDQFKRYKMVSAEGQVGYVTANLLCERIVVPVHPMPWFHGSIARFDAEKLLDRNKDGQFLLRTSQHTNGIFALAMVYNGEVQHYLVAMNLKKRSLTIDGAVYCDNLYELVEYYKRHSGVLGRKLSEAVIRLGQLDFFIDASILRRKWGVSKREISLYHVIGSGEFGEVYLGEYHGLQVAVKKLLPDKQNAQRIANFTKEAAIMTHLCHPNVTQLIGVYYHGSTLQSIIMELMGKGALSKYLMSRGRSVISLRELLSFSKDVCNGMIYISNMGFVHRDIAARNILLNGNGQAKISDLGLARKAEIHVPNEGGKFPTKWTAPEALKQSRFTVMSDVWSFGVLLWEVFSYGRAPYPSILSEHVLEQLEDGYRMDPPDKCPYPVYNIMEQCWVMDPTERPTFSKLKELLLLCDLGSSQSPSPQSPPLHQLGVTMESLIQLARSPAAVNLYKEAPANQKTVIFLATILLLGPQGSGKTTLGRTFKEELFQMHEPSSVSISLEQPCELQDHLSWRSSDEVLSFEEHLVKIVVDNLAKNSAQCLSLQKASGSSTHSHDDLLLAVDHDSSDVPFRRRCNSIPAKSEHQTVSPRPKTMRRFISSFRKSHSKMPKTSKHSSSRGPPKVTILHESPDDVFVGSYGDVTDCVDGERLSSGVIPDVVMRKIVSGLKCRMGTHNSRFLPPVFGRLVDCPGAKAQLMLRPLLVTNTSLSLVTFDISLDPHHVYAHSDSPSAEQLASCTTGSSIYLDHIMAEIADVCLHQPFHKMQHGATIVLLGTHSDKISASLASHRLSILTKTVNESPYKHCVASAKFYASLSSILERSNLDDIKQYLMDLTRKMCRQQIPLRWLNVVPEIDRLHAAGLRFITLEQLKTMSRQLCHLHDDNEFDDLLRFLSDNHVILHFTLVHQLSNVVINSPSWFLRNVSFLLSLTSNPMLLSQMPNDVELLSATGILTEDLLGLAWDEVSNKMELLQITHKMELVAFVSESDVSRSDKDFGNRGMFHSNHIAQVFIPALIEKEAPRFITNHVSSSDLSPLYFRFKNDHIPLGLYHRLVARCIHSYQKGVKLFVNHACFEVDNVTTLILSLKRDILSITLWDSEHLKEQFMDQENQRSSVSSFNISGNDVFLAVLMFVQAALLDIIHQWIPQLDYDLCVPCHCNSRNRDSVGSSHFVILNDSEKWMEAGILKCELGCQFVPLSGITRWFGGSSFGSQPDIDEDIELITVDDIITVANAIGHSWRELGNILGFSESELGKFSLNVKKTSLPLLFSNENESHSTTDQSPGEKMLHEWRKSRGPSARLFSLLSALEIIQRRDVADTLIAARMVGAGLMI